MNRKRVTIMIILIILGVIIFFVAIKARESYMESVVLRDVIYEGIYIDGIHIGGLSKADGLRLLKEKIEGVSMHKQLKIIVDERITYLIPYFYFERRLDYSVPIENAYLIGRSGTLKERYKEIKNIKKNGITLSLSDGYNEGRIKAFVEGVKEKQDILPKDATIKRENSAFIIKDEVIGNEVLIEENISGILKALSLEDEEVILQVIQKQPKVTKEVYKDIKDLVGSFNTNFSSSAYSRNENLSVACNKINNTIVLPGEVFSTNKVIGPINAANGYKEAPIILNGKIQPGIGGGVCQISTTLYNAVLLAELEVVERQNHSLPVGYIEKGRDATLAGDYIDFKFKNNKDVPIYIESYIKNNKVNMNIYSKETRNGGRKIEFEAIITDKTMPPPEKVTLDPSLKVGEEIVEKKSTIGYTVKLYKKIYINGALTDKQLINTSYYKATAAEIRRGTAPVQVDIPIPTINNQDEIIVDFDVINELDVPEEFYNIDEFYE